MPARSAPRIIFYAVVALLMLSELLLSNLGTLFSALEGTAASLGLSVGAEQARLLFLAALDGLAGGGALIAIWGVLGDRPATAKAGAWLSAFGLASYGLYQLVAALAQLAPAWRLPIAIVGVAYMLIGGAAWWVGRPLMAGRR